MYQITQATPSILIQTHESPYLLAAGRNEGTAEAWDSFITGCWKEYGAKTVLQLLSY